MDFNRVILLGRLTRAPESKPLPGGSAVVEFALAVNRRYKVRGEDKAREEVSFFDCKAFGRTGEIVNEYVGKGDPLLIDGELTQERWDGKDGKPRSKVLVTVREVVLLGGKGRDSAASRDEAEDRGRQWNATHKGSFGEKSELKEEDIPF